MDFITVFVSIFLSVLSTAVMGYIAMATPIGPWIAPTLALSVFGIVRLVGCRSLDADKVIGIVCAGSVGGILATACGFSFPTLYFLDPILFCSLMETPLYFVAMIGVLAFAAGFLGILCAESVEHDLIIHQQLPFPVGHLVYKTIEAGYKGRQTLDLWLGFFCTFIFSLLQDGVAGFQGCIPKSFIISSSRTIGMISLPLIRFDIWPMLWSIGFVTGHIISIPLIVGIFSKIMLIDPLHQCFFSLLSSTEFVLAFCSGMVLAGFLLGAPRCFFGIKKLYFESLQQPGKIRELLFSHLNGTMRYKWMFCIVLCMSYLSYFKFSFFSQIYLIVCSLICTYYVASIAGKIGLAQLGRFATFVMVPALIFFRLNHTQIVIVATFVEVCAGVAADILFGRKIAHLASLSSQKVRRYQYLGLVVSSFAVGVIFWFLIRQFRLGSPALFAQRAQARRLLIDAKNFNVGPLLAGALYGYALHHVRINSMLVLGGLLMPTNISLGLILGGALSMFVKDKEAQYPFWSGVFASNSVWMLLQAILGV